MRDNREHKMAGIGNGIQPKVIRCFKTAVIFVRTLNGHAMCYYKQDTALQSELENHYQAAFDAIYTPNYIESGFEYNPCPVLSQLLPGKFQFFHWGLVPWWVKSRPEADQIRLRTLNCISEEAFEKPSFRDSIRERRCIVPCTGFFEWRWFKGGKVKYPYFIHRKGHALFSLAGISSEWTDKSTGEVLSTYSVLTTRANQLMEKIHNSKKRMPVILPTGLEREWINPNLTKPDVLALCEPFSDQHLEAYTISKMITDRTVDNKNIAAIMKPFEYPELALMDA
jgi:putative SOS response-associated peptidase YedK